MVFLQYIAQGGFVMQKIVFLCLFLATAGCAVSGHSMVEQPSSLEASSLSREEGTLSQDQGEAKEDFAKKEIERIDEMEIWVLSAKILVRQNDPPREKIYSAATASPKNAKDLPYDKVGSIWAVSLNPSWTVPESIIREETAKGRKIKKFYAPGEKGNSLGKVKLFIKYGKWNSSLGIHGTNSPRSIGKRVSHGCNRLSEENIFELAEIILTQSGASAEDLLQKAAANPRKNILIKITDGPTVIYRQK